MDDNRGDGATQALAARAAGALFAADRAAHGAGIELVSVGPGEAAMTMTVDDAMLNGHGTCHGGYLFLLADSTFAYACNSHNQRTVAAHGDISFVRPVGPGEVLTARGREVWRAGRNGICDVTVTDHSGTTVAVFRGRSRTVGGPVAED